MYFVDLPGGLGNQLFAYFAGLYLRQKYGLRIRLQYSTTSKAHVGDLYNVSSFNLQLPDLRTRLPHTFLSPIYYPETNGVTRRLHKVLSIERVFRFATGADTRLHVDDFFRSCQPSYFPFRISSYFGDFDFFDNVDSESQKLTLVRKSNNFQKLLAKYNCIPVIGIHIRAGDYLNLKNTVGVLDDSYYLRSLSEARRLYPRALPLIFSNDFEYANSRAQRWKLSQFEVISPESLPDPAESLVLLSQCNFIVTSNSTFSLWAAKLSKEHTQVWLPNEWRKDGRPEINNIPTTWRRVHTSWEA